MRGESWAARRRRSEGPLDGGEIALARAQGVELAFDAAQTGWVPAALADDLVPPATAPPRAGGARRIGFRPWRSADVPLFRELLDDPAVWRHLPEPYPDPLTDRDALALIAVSNDGPHHTVRAILLDGRPVGQVRLAFMAGTDAGLGELGYWIGRAFWNRAIASEAVPLFVARMWRTHPGLGRIVARVHADNPASARVLEKLGAQPAGLDPRSPAWRLFVLDRGAANRRARSAAARHPGLALAPQTGAADRPSA